MYNIRYAILLSHLTFFSGIKNKLSKNLVDKDCQTKEATQNDNLLKGRELKLQIGQCIRIADILQVIFRKLDIQEKYENDKMNLQIETAEILKKL